MPDLPLPTAWKSSDATVAVVIPTLNEEESIAPVVAELPRDVVDRVIVVGRRQQGRNGRARAPRRRRGR